MTGAGPAASEASFHGTRASGLGASLAVAAAGAAVLLAHALYRLPFFVDDAFISLRYVQRFLDGQGLTWTDGDRVEGYSNLLWVLACAALGALGIDLMWAARILGVLGSAAALCAVVAAAPPRSVSDALPALAGALAFAVSGTVAIWTIGGLEQPLLVGLLGWAFVLLFPTLDPAGTGRERWLAPGLLLALVCLTRPDGALLVAGTLLGLLLVRGRDARSLRLAGRLALLPALAVLGQLAFRLAYYGEWVPNTALVKLAFGWLRLRYGLFYLIGGLGSLLPLVILAGGLAMVVVRGGAADRRIRFVGVPVLLWGVYIVAIGGDVNAAWRHHTLIALGLALMIAIGFAELEARGGGARVAARAGAAAALFLVWAIQLTDPQLDRARAERWQWDGEVVGRLLGTAFAAEQPLLAVDAAGSVPYFSRLPAVDMLGLSDGYLAHHPPADFGSGALGHELGDGAYVLSRKPDLVLFCHSFTKPEPCFRSGVEMMGSPEFAASYRLIRLEGQDPYRFRAVIWARAENGRIGIRRSQDEVVVPAWFATDTATSAAHLGFDRKLVVSVAPRSPAALSALPLAPGRWTVSAIGRGSPPRVLVSESGSKRWRSDQGSVAFELPDGAQPRVDVLVRAAPSQIFVLEAIRFERTPLEVEGRDPGEKHDE
jgi:hypothetical protein